MCPAPDPIPPATLLAPEPTCPTKFFDSPTITSVTEEPFDERYETINAIARRDAIVPSKYPDEIMAAKAKTLTMGLSNNSLVSSLS